MTSFLAARLGLPATPSARAPGCVSDSVLACLDVHYLADRARAGCVVARAWTDDRPASAWTVDVEGIQPYQPGQFARRELPCLLAALARAPPVDVIVIDGYVHLDEAGTPGLGGHLYHALGSRTPVVGIAKTAYRGSPMAVPVLRGHSHSPLFVTSVGLEQGHAAALVRSMAGPARIPALVSAVDRLCRTHSPH